MKLPELIQAFEGRISYPQSFETFYTHYAATKYLVAGDESTEDGSDEEEKKKRKDRNDKLRRKRYSSVKFWKHGLGTREATGNRLQGRVRRGVAEKCQEIYESQHGEGGQGGKSPLDIAKHVAAQVPFKIRDETVLEAWKRWMRQKHIAKVLARIDAADEEDDSDAKWYSVVFMNRVYAFRKLVFNDEVFRGGLVFVARQGEGEDNPFVRNDEEGRDPLAWWAWTTKEKTPISNDNEGMETVDYVMTDEIINYLKQACFLGMKKFECDGPIMFLTGGRRSPDDDSYYNIANIRKPLKFADVRRVIESVTENPHVDLEELARGEGKMHRDTEQRRNASSNDSRPRSPRLFGMVAEENGDDEDDEDDVSFQPEDDLEEEDDDSDEDGDEDNTQRRRKGPRIAAHQMKRLLRRLGFGKGPGRGVDPRIVGVKQNQQHIKYFKREFLQKVTFGTSTNTGVIFFDETSISPFIPKSKSVFRGKNTARPFVTEWTGHMRATYNLFLAVGLFPNPGMQREGQRDQSVPFIFIRLYCPTTSSAETEVNRRFALPLEKHEWDAERGGILTRLQDDETARDYLHSPNVAQFLARINQTAEVKTERDYDGLRSDIQGALKNMEVQAEAAESSEDRTAAETSSPVDEEVGMATYILEMVHKVIMKYYGVTARELAEMSAGFTAHMQAVIRDEAGQQAFIRNFLTQTNLLPYYRPSLADHETLIREPGGATITTAENQQDRVRKIQQAIGMPTFGDVFLMLIYGTFGFEHTNNNAVEGEEAEQQQEGEAADEPIVTGMHREVFRLFPKGKGFKKVMGNVGTMLDTYIGTGGVLFNTESTNAREPGVRGGRVARRRRRRGVVDDTAGDAEDIEMIPEWTRGHDANVDVPTTIYELLRQARQRGYIDGETTMYNVWDDASAHLAKRSGAQKLHMDDENNPMFPEDLTPAMRDDYANKILSNIHWIADRMLMGTKCVILPPYSPHYNPCERFNNMLKMFIMVHGKRIVDAKTAMLSETQLIMLVQEYVDTVDAKHTLNTFRATHYRLCEDYDRVNGESEEMSRVEQLRRLMHSELTAEQACNNPDVFAVPREVMQSRVDPVAVACFNRENNNLVKSIMPPEDFTLASFANGTIGVPTWKIHSRHDALFAKSVPVVIHLRPDVDDPRRQEYAGMPTPGDDDNGPSASSNHELVHVRAQDGASKALHYMGFGTHPTHMRSREVVNDAMNGYLASIRNLQSEPFDNGGRNSSPFVYVKKNYFWAIFAYLFGDMARKVEGDRELAIYKIRLVNKSPRSVWIRVYFRFKEEGDAGSSSDTQQGTGHRGLPPSTTPIIIGTTYVAVNTPVLRTPLHLDAMLPLYGLLFSSFMVNTGNMDQIPGERRAGFGVWIFARRGGTTTTTTTTARVASRATLTSRNRGARVRGRGATSRASRAQSVTRTASRGRGTGRKRRRVDDEVDNDDEDNSSWHSSASPSSDSSSSSDREEITRVDGSRRREGARSVRRPDFYKP